MSKESKFQELYEEYLAWSHDDLAGELAEMKSRGDNIWLEKKQLREEQPEKDEGDN